MKKLLVILFYFIINHSYSQIGNINNLYFEYNINSKIEYDIKNKFIDTLINKLDTANYHISYDYNIYIQDSSLFEKLNIDFEIKYKKDISELFKNSIYKNHTIYSITKNNTIYSFKNSKYKTNIDSIIIININTNIQLKYNLYTTKIELYKLYDNNYTILKVKNKSTYNELLNIIQNNMQLKIKDWDEF